MENHRQPSLLRQIRRPALEWLTGFLVLYWTLPSLVLWSFHVAHAFRGNALGDSSLDKLLILFIINLGMFAAVWSAIGLMRFLLQRIGIESFFCHLARRLRQKN